MVWFTSDLHFGHKGALTLSNRPYSSVEEMNEALITNWNNVVAPFSDEVYLVGDFALTNKVDLLKGWFNRLNGRKHLIMGNHDQLSKMKQLDWESISDIKEVKHKKQKIVLCHYAMRVWKNSHQGYYHLFGHSHGNLEEDNGAYSFDVGVDANNYTPVSFDQVVERMSKKVFKQVDHHEYQGR